jgi:anti-sigma-K factor RskA
MAQQSRKRRQTKHRGNAAGMVETRGRTGRKPTDSEKPVDRKAAARQARIDRFNRPPTWRGALNRAAIAAVLFVVAVILLGQQPATAVSLGALMLLLYVPMSYYTDLMIYNRRQKKKKAAA